MIVATAAVEYYSKRVAIVADGANGGRIDSDHGHASIFPRDTRNRHEADDGKVFPRCLLSHPGEEPLGNRPALGKPLGAPALAGFGKSANGPAVTFQETLI